MGGSFNLGTIFTVLKLQDEFSSGVKAASINADGSFGRIVASQDAMARSLTNINKLAKEFSGADIAKKADEIAGAVKRVGGASTLTEAEQRKVNRVVSEAIEKYRALGQEAPAHLLKIQKETANTAKSAGALGGSVGSIAAGFAVGGLIDKGIGAIISLGTEAFQTAGQIVDLSKETGLSTTAVQQMGFAATQSGSNLDKWAATIFKAGINIEKGTDDVKSGLKGLGLEYERIRAMKPEQQFDTIMRALAGIEDPQRRNLLGVQALGEGYKDVAAAVDDYIEMVEGAPVASEAAIKATDAAAKAIARAWDSAKATAINVIGGILAAFQDYDDKVKKAGPINQSVAGQQHALPNPFAPSVGGQRAVQVAPIVEDVKKVATETEKATKATADYAKQLADVRAKVAAITPAIRGQIDAALALGTKVEDIAEAYDLTSEAVNYYKESSKKATDAAKEGARVVAEVEKNAAEAKKRWIKEDERLALEAIKLVAAAEAQRVKDELENAAALAKLAADAAAFQNKLNKDAEKIALDAINRVAAEFNAAEEAKRQAAIESAEQFAGNLANVGALAGQLGGAFGQVGQFIVSAFQTGTNLVGDYILAMKAAETQAQATAAAANLITGAFTFGFSAVISGIVAGRQALARLREDIEGMKAEIIELGATPIEIPQPGGMAAKTMATIQAKILETQLEQLRQKQQELEQAARELDQTMGRYGLTLDDVGSAADQHSVSAAKLAKDFELLAQKGFTVETVVGASRKQLEALVASAKATGQELPASLAPYIEELERLQRVDAQVAAAEQLKAAATEAAEKAAKAAEAETARINGLMSKYGVTVDDVGTKQEIFARKAGQMAKELAELSGKGFSVETLTKGSASGLNDMIAAAIDAGQKLPASLKPYIDELIRSGQLNDDLKAKMLGVADPVPWEQMKEAAEKYGIGLDQLGQKYAQSELNAMSAALVADWDLLVENGANVGSVMDGMSEKVSAMVENAIAHGLELPESMRPMIEKMAEAGKLVDENGEKLEGIGDVKFAAPVVSETDKLITKMDEFIEKLVGPTGVGKELAGLKGEPKVDTVQAKAALDDLIAKATHPTDGLAAAFAAMEIKPVITPIIKWPDGIPPPSDVPWMPTVGPSSGGYPGAVETAHTGALVVANRIKRYHTGGTIIPFPRLRSDEVPAVLQTGEAVLNRQATSALGESAIADLNTGRSRGGATITLAPTIVVQTSPGMSEEAIAQSVKRSLERNTASLLTTVRQKVG